MLGLVDCKTADEVLENYKRVRARIRNLRSPEPPPEPEPIPERVVAPVAPFVIIPKMTVAPVHFQEAEPIIQHPSIHRIIGAVCQKYDIARNDLVSARRTAKIVRPRQIAMYLAKQLTLKSLPEIGRHIGDKDHTTVLHSVRQITKLRAQMPDLDKDLTELETLLGGTDVSVG